VTELQTTQDDLNDRMARLKALRVRVWVRVKIRAWVKVSVRVRVRTTQDDLNDHMARLRVKVRVRVRVRIRVRTTQFDLNDRTVGPSRSTQFKQGRPITDICQTYNTPLIPINC